MNEFNIVGKVEGGLEVKQSDNGYNYAQMVLSVKRPFKNKEGGQDYDLIQFTMFGNLIEDAKGTVANGIPLLVKGHINSSNYQKDGKNVYSSSIIADRITIVDQLY